MLTTTTIGAYPKPESVAVETWFGERTRRPAEGYEEALEKMGANAAELFDAAVADSIEASLVQPDLGQQALCRMPS